jgi:Na+-transporting NADH:ubiquinone oxidoreductase subunit NqrF
VWCVYYATLCASFVSGSGREAVELLCWVDGYERVNMYVVFEAGGALLMMTLVAVVAECSFQAQCGGGVSCAGCKSSTVI